MKRIARAGRHLMLDLTPLRRSHDLRCLFAGQLASTLGSQLTTVAVPYQVCTRTHSSLAVGLVSLAQLLDINAMVFGMPRAVFPALASTVFGGGARTLGFLYAAPGAGALLGALTTGWVRRVQRQGRAVIIAVLVWGTAITCFGLVSWLAAALPGAAS